jgi:hypothetical protein
MMGIAKDKSLCPPEHKSVAETKKAPGFPDALLDALASGPEDQAL